MTEHPTEVLKGTLDLLILTALSLGAKHGYGLARWMRSTTDDAIQVEDGALYPALYRLLKRGWIQADWKMTENNRRAKYYSLTSRGKRQLKRETARWGRFSLAVGKVLRAGATEE